MNRIYNDSCACIDIYLSLYSIVGLRVSSSEEDAGLDESYHGRCHASIYLSISSIHLFIFLSVSHHLSTFSYFLGESLMVSLNPERRISSHEPGITISIYCA